MLGDFVRRKAVNTRESHYTEPGSRRQFSCEGHAAE